MVEKVGECVTCKKIIYCTDGFLNGVVKNSEVYCFTCAEKSDQNRHCSSY
ncbi:hypothetical protein [Metabacillus halosaccharovorans]|uniref:GapA-binding peptide SR1P n=1 Tax=Metabacillus halosaccharovorans TaxID=930124 RepID=A0ABT3DG13_9BACI|nr:hypothetical protein [Metabacillus halosaccharovorans]MCV9885612.1 hypothetical protein [Metabacillus halosaccharovorans]